MAYNSKLRVQGNDLLQVYKMNQDLFITFTVQGKIFFLQLTMNTCICFISFVENHISKKIKIEKFDMLFSHETVLYLFWNPCRNLCKMRTGKKKNFKILKIFEKLENFGKSLKFLEKILKV